MFHDLSHCNDGWPKSGYVRIISKSVVRVEDSKPIRIIPRGQKKITEYG